MANNDMETLCNLAGVLETDTQAVAKLRLSYERAKEWYRQAGCSEDNPAFKWWAMDLACWFHDNLGATDAQIPPYIVSSVHQLRVVEDE